MADNAPTMKAATYDRYGPPDIISVREVPAPTLHVKRPVIVEVHAAALNPLDLHYLGGMPYFMRLSSGLRTPKRSVTGVDFAGTVVQVEPEVEGVSVGDEVFGVSDGACAELISVAESKIVKKLDGHTFAEAAACGVAGLTALQGLVDKGGLESGQRVLINGASGGVGTFAVQIAHALGAEVTAVCSARNMDLVASLGADRVVDYTSDNFLEIDAKYDIVLDNMGNRSPRACRKIMKSNGRYVLIGGPKANKATGPLFHMARSILAFAFRSQKAIPFVADASKDKLDTLRDALETLSVRPVIDRAYPLVEVPEALSYLAQGHAQGKVVITTDS